LPPPTLAAKKLSPRLKAALDLIPSGAAFADVACDHAHLAIAGVLAGAPRAIAVDIAERPLRVARKNAGFAGVLARISLRLGDGLAPLEPGEVAGVVVAGVGGRTCLQILAPAQLERLDLAWLVLQVNRDLPKVRTWLAAHGWRIERETLVRDGRRIFPTLLATPNHPMQTLTPAQAYLGELGRDADLNLHIEHLQRRAAKLRDEVLGLRKAQQRRAGQPDSTLLERAAWLAAVEKMLAQRLDER